MPSTVLSMPKLLGIVPMAASLLQATSAQPTPRLRPSSVRNGTTNGNLTLGSACSQYSGDDVSMCSLCTTQTSFLGDCFWCSEDNSCHDFGSLDYPASCSVDGCVSHSTLTDCTGSCASESVSGFDVPLAQCMLGISNASYYTGKSLTEAMQIIGITDYKTMTDTKLNTQGVVIAHPDANAITIAFRGTELTAANEKLDVDCTFDTYQSKITTDQSSLTGSWEVADGFATAYTSLQDEMRSNINWALGLVGTSPKVYITGHSLGAAMATIAASDFMLSNMTSLVGDVEVMTFAAPRSGNPAFATGVGSLAPNWWSIQNFFDQIPHLPPQSWGTLLLIARLQTLPVLLRRSRHP